MKLQLSKWVKPSGYLPSDSLFSTKSLSLWRSTRRSSAGRDRLRETHEELSLWKMSTSEDLLLYSLLLKPYISFRWVMWAPVLFYKNSKIGTHPFAKQLQQWMYIWFICLLTNVYFNWGQMFTTSSAYLHLMPMVLSIDTLYTNTHILTMKYAQNSTKHTQNICKTAINLLNKHRTICDYILKSHRNKIRSPIQSKGGFT